MPQVLFARAQVVIPEADRVLLKKLCPDPGLLEGFLSFGVFFPRSYVRVGADREDEGVGVAGYGEGIHSAWRACQKLRLASASRKPPERRSVAAWVFGLGVRVRAR